MARQVRIIFEGAYYHVINRGQGKRKVYLDKEDCKTFLNLLRDTCQIYNVNVIAFCLMGNHYHLLVNTPNANLPDFMRQLNGVYTLIFNKRYKYDGSLFKGRYKANVVQEGSYLLRLIRYIHRNPVRAKMVKKCEEYIFSSHNSYIKGEESQWLKYKETLRTQWKGKGSLILRYKEFMKMKDEEFEKYLNIKHRKAVNAIILGDEDFMDEVKMKYLHTKRNYGEIPQAKRIKVDLLIKKIKREVIKVFGVSEKEFIQSRRGKENLARMVAIGLARENGGLPYRDIGRIFGGISYKSAAKYCERLKVRCAEEKELNKVFSNLKLTCSQVET